MRTFRDFLNEEVMPSVFTADGSIDINKESVRDGINKALSHVTTCPGVTPYVALMKIRKVLGYFAIHLPKRTFMEGRHGVEVWDIHQFGEKMGMTDQGEFVKSVPCNYYLFLHYHMIGSMYMVRARIVDKEQLDKELDVAESMIKEDAETMQHVQKASAPKEKQHTALGDCDCSQGDSPSTKSAVDVSMRRKDKKLSADKLDEVSMGTLVRYKRGAEKSHDDATWETKFTKSMGDDASPSKALARKREKGIALADKKMKGKAKVGASADKHPYMEESVEEGWVSLGLPYDKFGDRNPHAKIYTSNDRKSEGPKDPKPGEAEPGAGDTYQHSKQGHGKSRNARSLKKEETLDEISKDLAQRYGEKSFRAVKDAEREKANFVKTTLKSRIDPQHVTGTKFDDTIKKRVSGMHKAAKIVTRDNKKIAEEQIEEKLTKRMSAADVIKDFVHSDDPKFKGKSKKERMKMALGAYYGMHSEKSKKNLEEDNYAMRQMKTKMMTKILHGLGVERETKTVRVKRKDDPSGKIIRISKSKYDPSKYQTV